MSKVIVSPVERWAGTVTLSDPLTLPQMAAYHAAIMEAKKLDDATAAMFYNALMPGVYACIQKFELKNWPGVTAELFPGKPTKDASKMAAWLIEEVGKLANEEEAEAVPKESSGTLTPKPSDSSAPKDEK